MSAVVVSVLSGIFLLGASVVAGRYALKASDSRGSVQEFLAHRLELCEREREKLLDHARRRPASGGGVTP